MKNFFLIIITSVVAIFTVNYLVFAWTEPASTPPNDNVPAPLNVGVGRQIKSGDITLNNLKANSITLGEETRFAWPSGGGATAGSACAWEGTKCDCSDDSSTFADLALTMGLTCLGGKITDFGIVNMQISSGHKDCPNSAPAVCTPSLYTHD